MRHEPRIAVNSRVSVGDHGTAGYDEGVILEIEGGPFARALVRWVDGTANWIQISLLEDP